MPLSPWTGFGQFLEGLGATGRTACLDRVSAAEDSVVGPGLVKILVVMGLMVLYTRV